MYFCIADGGDTSIELATRHFQEEAILSRKMQAGCFSSVYSHSSGETEDKTLVFMLACF